MEKASAAVSKFMSKAGHHDTTVHESVAPAITKETVKPTQHENVTTAVNKEVHQDHHHTAVQPVKDTQVLEEQHHHNVAPVEKREFHHGKDEHVKQKLAETAAGFKDSKTVEQTRETRSAQPIVAGEHVHHHVHETIQPVIERETIQPHVVHTTVPIQEVHHKDPKHHQVTSLPAVSMNDFKKHEGGLSGRGEHFERFDGEPKTIGSQHHGVGNHESRSGEHQHLGGHERGSNTSGLGSSTTGEHGLGSSIGQHGLGSSTTGQHGLGSSTGQHGLNTHDSHSTTGQHGLGSSTGQHGLGSSTGQHDLNKHDSHSTTGQHGHGTHGSHSSSGQQQFHDKHDVDKKHKPTLKEKLDPRIDADGDGKAGFMS